MTHPIRTAATGRVTSDATMDVHTSEQAKLIWDALAPDLADSADSATPKIEVPATLSTVAPGTAPKCPRTHPQLGHPAEQPSAPPAAPPAPAAVPAPPAPAAGPPPKLTDELTRSLLAFRQYIEVRRLCMGSKATTKPWKLRVRRLPYLVEDVLSALYLKPLSSNARQLIARTYCGPATPPL